MQSKKKIKLLYFISSLMILTSCTINLPGSGTPNNPSTANSGAAGNSSSGSTPGSSTASGVAANTSASTNTSANTESDQKERDYIVNCIQSAAASAPNLGEATIETYCGCTLYQFKSGATDQQAVVSGCAQYAGIPINNGGSSSSSSSGDSSCGSSYEDQLVCSGIPAAALPHVPPS